MYFLISSSSLYKGEQTGLLLCFGLCLFVFTLCYVHFTGYSENHPKSVQRERALLSFLFLQLHGTPLRWYCWGSLHFFTSLEQGTDCPLFQSIFTGMFVRPTSFKNRDRVSLWTKGSHACCLFLRPRFPSLRVHLCIHCTCRCHLALCSMGTETQETNAKKKKKSILLLLCLL